jgi:hypothetical protein
MTSPFRTLPPFNWLYRHGENIRLHGNRFIQIDLSKEVRIHIWSDILPIAQERPAPIHDHAYSFTSHIVSGQLINVQYRISETVSSPFSMKLCNEMAYDIWTVSADKNILEKTPKTAILKPNGIDYYRRGGEYRMWPKMIHAAAYVGHAITVCSVSPPGPGAVRVFIPHNSTPDNVYRRDKYSADYLWDLVDMVYQALGTGPMEAEEWAKIQGLQEQQHESR